MFRNKSFFIILVIAAALLTGCANPATPTSTITPMPLDSPTPSMPTKVPLATFTPIPVPHPDGLYVDPSIDLGPISPYVYGTNYGPWIALPASMIPDAKTAGMNIIRFPGGAWGDINDLRHYQIDDFMAFCRMLGAVPSISVRLHNGTPEQAAAMVTYVNINKKYGVKYWSIGNEPTLYTNEGKGVYDTPQFNAEWRAIAQAMKAVDPTILLIGPELHQFTANPAANPKDSAGRDWMTEFLKANGDLVDVVSIHRYPFPKNRTDSTSIDDLRKNTAEWTDILRYLSGLIRDTAGRDIPVAVTEFSTHYNKAVGGDATPDSHYAAIWLADLLGRFINENVVIANHWMLTSYGDQGGWGLIGRGELRPTYYTYQLYQKFGSGRIFSSSDQANVHIYAARNQAGALTLMVINMADEPAAVPLSIKGVGDSLTANVWLLDATHKAESMPDQSLSNGAALQLPGQSVTLLIIK